MRPSWPSSGLSLLVHEAPGLPSSELRSSNRGYGWGPTASVKQRVALREREVSPGSQRGACLGRPARAPSPTPLASASPRGRRRCCYWRSRRPSRAAPSDPARSSAAPFVLAGGRRAARAGCRARALRSRARSSPAILLTIGKLGAGQADYYPGRFAGLSNGPGRTRTCDRRIMSPLL
jgi:hypothetical protein